MNNRYLKIKEGFILPDYLVDYGYGSGDVVEVIKYLDDKVLCKLGGYTLEHELSVYIPLSMLEVIEPGVLGNRIVEYHQDEDPDAPAPIKGIKHFSKLYHMEYHPSPGYGKVKGQKQVLSQFHTVDFADAKLPEEEKGMELVSETQKVYLVIKLGNLYIDELEYSIEKSMNHYQEHGHVIKQCISVSTEVGDAVRFRLSDLRLVKDFAYEIGGTVEAIRTIVILERGSIEDLENYLKKNPDKKIEGN
ncbi:hypothetical protein EG878_14740 [Enterococcus faecalis]|nr:hypothetical protein EG878_14740 [Enterococcus faecalis]